MKSQFWSRAVILVAICLFILSSETRSQWTLTPADSLSYEKAKNDTAKLSQMASVHRGDRVGAKAQNRLGWLAYLNKKPEIAQQKFASTYSLYPNRPESFEAAYFLGVVTDKSDKFEEAKRNLQVYVANNPNDGDVDYWEYLIIRAMSETNDSNFIPSAHTYLRSKHVSQEWNPTLQNELARFSFETGDFLNTLVEAQKVIDNYPNSKYVRYAEGDILESNIALGNSQVALDFANTLLSKYGLNNDDAARAQLNIASIYENRGDLDRARSEYSKVVNLHPSTTYRVAAAEYSLIMIDLRQARERNDNAALKSAAKDLKEFVSNHPKDHSAPRALMSIADLAAQNGKVQDAIDAYNAIIQYVDSLVVGKNISRLSPDLKGLRELAIQAHMFKGVLLRVQMKNSRSALAEFDYLVGVNQNNTAALLNKAMCLIDIGRKREARIILQQLVDKQTDLKDAASQLLKTI